MLAISHYFTINIVRTGDKLENAPDKANEDENGRMLPVGISQAWPGQKLVHFLELIVQPHLVRNVNLRHVI